MNRRTLLRSLAGTTIGLPFLEEMSATTQSANNVIPMRAFNVFFGLGSPSSLNKPLRLRFSA